MAQTPTTASVTQKPHKSVSDRAMSWRLACMEFMGKIAENLSGYTNVLLKSVFNFTATQVSLIQSINSFIGIFSSPFWGIVSDKRRTIRIVLLICFILSAVTYPFVPVSAANVLSIIAWQIPLVMFLLPVNNFFQTPARTLLENYVVRTANTRNLNFGLIRVCGSISYAITGVVLGRVLDNIGGPRTTFWLYPIALIPVIVLCFFINDEESFSASNKKTLKFREMNFKGLFKDFYYVTYLIYAVVLRFPMGSSMIYLPYLISDMGLSASVYATISGVRAATEIPLMMLFKQLRKRIPLYYMLIFAAACYAIESILMRFVTTEISLICVTALHGIGNSVNLTAAANYIYVLAPDDLKATSQTFNGAAVSVAGILAPLIGGVLVDRIGAANYFFWCGIVIAVAGVLYALSFPIGEKLLKKPAPGITP